MPNKEQLKEAIALVSDRLCGECDWNYSKEEHEALYLLISYASQQADEGKTNFCPVCQAREQGTLGEEQICSILYEVLGIEHLKLS